MPWGSIMTVFRPGAGAAERRLEIVVEEGRDPGPDSGGEDRSAAWVFQANPKRFDLLQALDAGSTETWPVNQHRQDIQPGAALLGTSLFDHPAGELHEDASAGLGEHLALPGCPVLRRSSPNHKERPVFRDTALRISCRTRRTTTASPQRGPAR